MAKDLDIIDFGPGPDEDFVPYYAGSEDCAPGHSWRGIRDHFLVHVVRAGKGRVFLSGSEAGLAAGSGFLICPGEVAHYVADAGEPWSYSWIGFAGRRARAALLSMGLSEESPFFHHSRPKELLRSMRELAAALGSADPSPPMPSGSAARALAAAGRLALCLASLASGLPEPAARGAAKGPGVYLDAVMEWVRRNYSRPARVAELADRIGLDRKYLATLCKEKLGKGPKELLLGYRMERAEELLRAGRLSVREVADSVGYGDQLAFSKAFRARYGAAPREYALRTGRGPRNGVARRLET